jgi:hypothetical protein
MDGGVEGRKGNLLSEDIISKENLDLEFLPRPCKQSVEVISI